MGRECSALIFTWLFLGLTRWRSYEKVTSRDGHKKQLFTGFRKCAPRQQFSKNQHETNRSVKNWQRLPRSSKPSILKKYFHCNWKFKRLRNPGNTAVTQLLLHASLKLTWIFFKIFFMCYTCERKTKWMKCGFEHKLKGSKTIKEYDCFDIKHLQGTEIKSIYYSL